MSSSGCRGSTGKAKKSAVQQGNSFEYCSMGDGVLVGSSADGRWIYHFDGSVHKMLCCSHSIFKSKKDAASEDWRYAEETDQYS
jgi:hypothetical protein